MRILLIEDDPKTVALLRKGFAEAGATIDAESDGDAGLDRAKAGGYDLVVLDVLLPKRDGWRVLHGLRAAGQATPVVMLTARDAVPDRVRGLELGADDYLVKPFAFAELLARCRRLLRRGAPLETVRIADLEIDLVRQKASRQGTGLDLTPKEFALLSLLARHAGEALSRDSIAREVWGVQIDPETNVIDVHVRRLRAKADDPFPRKLIHTVRGVGYVLQDRG